MNPLKAPKRKKSTVFREEWVMPACSWFCDVF